MRLDDRIVGERIIIRNYEAEDKEFCTSMWFDKENGKYMSDPTEEYVDEKYRKAIDTMHNDDDGYYFIIEHITEGKPIGTCCAFPVEDNGIDIGYCINKRFWRNGYATEAVKKIIDWSKSKSYKTITAEVAKENEASCGLLKSLGFEVKKESSFKKYNMDVYFDSYIFQYNL